MFVAVEKDWCICDGCNKRRNRLSLGRNICKHKILDFCPYSWMPRLMVPTIGILPNGVPVSEEAGNLPVSLVMVILALLLSVILFSALIRLGAKGFSRQEVR